MDDGSTDQPGSRLMMKQASDLFPDENERKEFVDAILAGESKEQAIIVLHDKPEIGAFPKLPPFDWQPDYVLRIQDHFRAAKHALYAKGAFYSLDFSSVFSASAMLAIEGPVVDILDMCASPGGKAIFAWRTFQPDVLLCNEVIRKRTGALIGNLARCGCERSYVWSADPSVYAREYGEAFDLVLADAPCSGQSLIAKGEDAVGCWSPNMVDMNVGRQRRIVGNGVKCLKPGGYLLYATCTYSIKENERVIAWALKEHPELEAVVVPHLEANRSIYAEFPSYRLFPHQGMGAGAFVALLRKKGERPEHRIIKPEQIMSHWRYGDITPAERKQAYLDAKAAQEAERLAEESGESTTPKPAVKAPAKPKTRRSVGSKGPAGPLRGKGTGGGFTPGGKPSYKKASKAGGRRGARRAK